VGNAGRTEFNAAMNARVRHIAGQRAHPDRIDAADSDPDNARHNPDALELRPFDADP
jgi:hypothetical protein